jgi:hypothetical protein
MAPGLLRSTPKPHPPSYEHHYRQHSKEQSTVHGSSALCEDENDDSKSQTDQGNYEGCLLHEDLVECKPNGLS